MTYIHRKTMVTSKLQRTENIQKPYIKKLVTQEIQLKVSMEEMLSCEYQIETWRNKQKQSENKSLPQCNMGRNNTFLTNFQHCNLARYSVNNQIDCFSLKQMYLHKKMWTFTNFDCFKMNNGK